MILYHVTTDQGLVEIMKNGLIPQFGERSKLSEDDEAIYLFNSLEDKDNALSNWLGEAFEDYNGILHTLLIDLPDYFDHEKTCGWETVVYEKIPVECISYYCSED